MDDVTGRSRKRKRQPGPRRRDHAYPPNKDKALPHKDKDKDPPHKDKDCSGSSQKKDSSSTQQQPGETVHQVPAFRKKSCRHRQQCKDGKRRRNRVQCLIDDCKALVVNLGRHIRQIHTDIPEFEVRQLLQRKKKEPKRRYRLVTCCVDGCTWKGTRPDKHLVSKAHNFEKHHAKTVARQIRLESHPGGMQPLGKNMHTAESLADAFLVWYKSIEGGRYIGDHLEDHKQKQKEKQNRKFKQMVQTVLETCLGTGEFHTSQLSKDKRAHP